MFIDFKKAIDYSQTINPKNMFHRTLVNMIKITTNRKSTSERRV